MIQNLRQNGQRLLTDPVKHEHQRRQIQAREIRHKVKRIFNWAKRLLLEYEEAPNVDRT